MSGAQTGESFTGSGGQFKQYGLLQRWARTLTEVLLQNPYVAPLATTIAVGRKEVTALPDHITVTMGPLEVGRLVMPLRFKNGTEAKVKISCARQRESRTRAKGEGALDVSGSALGILGGLMTAALTPVGHFSVTRRGGDVANPFSLPFEMPSGSENGRITYERLWSPEGIPPAEVTVVRRPEVGTVITTTGYVLAVLGGLLAAIVAAFIPTGGVLYGGRRDRRHGSCRLWFVSRVLALRGAGSHATSNELSR